MGTLKTSQWLTLVSVLAAASSWNMQAYAQAPFGAVSNTSREAPDLPPDSPFVDPDIIYLEADELIDNTEDGTLTARGQVEGKYQDRTLRADEVIYNVETGRVVASGNVVLIDTKGATQYADKLELSGELETGTAANFTARLAEGGLLGSKFVTRSAEEGVQLYNAYYTACSACKEDGSPKRPTWRIRARKVVQDQDQNAIKYRDAVIEFKGIPLFYTPYMAHPDPSAGRTSGWLNPFGSISGARGVGIETPYYFALDDHSELTVTPHIFQKVNPIIEADYRRLFHSGEININGSFTYASPFDNDGNAFTDAAQFTNPDEATIGRRLRSHIFADGLFNFGENWQAGAGVQLASDDLYLDRYSLNETPKRFGLYDAASRRLVSQAFIVGQDDDFRFSTSAYGFQSLRTSIIPTAGNPDLFTVIREDDSTLPIIAPKIELEKYLKDPVLGGRFKAYGDTTLLTRRIGTDYTRLSGGADYSKSFIIPGGIEAKPFGGLRYDYFQIQPDFNGEVSGNGGAAEIDFSRTLGQVGADIRWPFIRAGKNVDLMIEPRVQITQNFGNAELQNFQTVNTLGQDVSLFQDSLDVDLDQALFWSSNKSTGFDFWQEGLRTDVGASFIANWAKNRAHIFVGQSYVSGADDDFSIASGLAGNTSDIVGLFELELGPRFSTQTRLRYDDDNDVFRRIDTGFRYNSKRFRADIRYFRLDETSQQFAADPTAPGEELSGSVTLKLAKHWSTRYRIARDIDQDVTRSQTLSLIYDDDCTRIELLYQDRNNNLGVVGNDSRFGIRISLLTLGDFSPQ